MTAFYCDFDAGAGTAPYDTWAKAGGDPKTVIEACTADDDVVYIRASSAGRFDFASAVVIYNTTVSAFNGRIIIQGCLDGTTAEPPVKADHAVVGDARLQSQR